MAGKRIPEKRKPEFVTKIRMFVEEKYKKELVKAINQEKPLVIEFSVMDKFSPELADALLNSPSEFLKLAEEAVEQIQMDFPVKVRFMGLPELTNIRDLRARHIGRFLAVEGVVRKASEIRPEITHAVWECPECGDQMRSEAKGNFIYRPFKCKCGNREGFKQIGTVMIDTRMIVLEEPFELTEGERPSQVVVRLREDLVSPDGRRMSDPGNRLRITGELKEVPKGKLSSARLDFFVEANHVQPTEAGWERLEISKRDEKEIKETAGRDDVYDLLVASLAPSIYGMTEIKESIIMQLFGGVPRKMSDGTSIRGDIHILLVGDPSSGKSQLLKLVPDIVPRGRYVSGKGVTGAGLTATVTKDEQFMGGWVLEAGALVLSNKGLLSIDEFEKMSSDDQVAMHEALEQGSISIAKASIVATLPAKTSVLAGGNPKFSRFDPYLPISKQITIPETLLSRFDLKFALRDLPDSEQDKKIVDHILGSREKDYEASKPKLNADFIRKYIAYAREHCMPELTPEAGKFLRNFYIKTRKKAEKENMAIPITLRQFEAMIRIAEASAKIQLQERVRKEDAQRAIKLMRFSLRQLGFDPETGQIDVDRAEGASTTSSERGKIKAVLDIINDLAAVKKEVLVEDIRTLAKKDGIEEIDEILDKLRREGMLFEPSPGYVQKV